MSLSKLCSLLYKYEIGLRGPLALNTTDKIVPKKDCIKCLTESGRIVKRMWCFASTTFSTGMIRNGISYVTLKGPQGCSLSANGLFDNPAIQ